MSQLPGLATGGPAGITLYAQYTPVSYTVTFDPAGGSPAPAGQSVTYGGLVTEPSDPAESGSTFTGWYDGATAWDFASDTVTGNLTLSAHYTPITLTVATSDGAPVAAGSTLHRGDPVIVTVGGLESDTDYTLSVHSAPITVAHLHTDADGHGTASFTIPDLPAGSHSIVLTDQTDAGLADFAFLLPLSPPPSSAPPSSAPPSSAPPNGTSPPPSTQTPPNAAPSGTGDAAATTGTADTGADLATPLGLALALLVIGAGVLTTTRRRHHH